jgi:hypothetical protein
VDVEVDELGVLLDELLERVRLQEVVGLLLQVQRHGGAPLECVAARVLRDGELLAVRLPDVLLVLVVLGGHHNAVGNQKGGVEAHAELADQVLGKEKEQGNWEEL